MSFLGGRFIFCHSIFCLPGLINTLVTHSLLLKAVQTDKVKHILFSFFKFPTNWLGKSFLHLLIHLFINQWLRAGGPSRASHGAE